ncbi:ion channel protein [Agromyces seonyuensis]|uniref:Ion channel protein n=1 Tax=Agromyces seonyuensis TaxID=2662446 RepID=A0A6I4P3L8_9MICO|nr:ion channel protein [Agromyces seonyuensis]MWB97927.1 ion channel protein [Agromyces seonyuensis]
MADGTDSERAAAGAAPEGEALAPSVKTLALMAIPALLIGAVSALVLWCLDRLAEYLQDWLWGSLPSAFGISPDSPWWIIGMLTVVGLAIGAVVQFVPGHAGPDSAHAEIGDDEPPLPLHVLPSLLVVVTISLAGGVSLGPENPIIAINSAIAVAALTRFTRIPGKLGMLLASAATIGALFGTPVAAALVLTGTVATLRMGGSLWDKLFLPLAAAGTGAVTMHLLGSPAFAFSVEPLETVDFSALAWIIGIAIASAAAGILAAWLLPHVHRLFHALKHPIVFTTLGGLVLGLLGAIGGPITLFKGLEQTGELIDDPTAYTAWQLVLIVLIKVFALVVAAAAGFRGGRIFPIVFIGTAVGVLAMAVFPDAPPAAAIAAGAFGATLAATKDGWIAIFVGVALVGDLHVLPLLCIAVLPLWLLVTKAPELVVKRRATAPPTVGSAAPQTS